MDRKLPETIKQFVEEMKKQSVQVKVTDVTPEKPKKKAEKSA